MFKPQWRVNYCRAQVLQISLSKAGLIHLDVQTDKRFRAFKAGQHTQVMIEHQGRLLSRTFSYSSCAKQHAKEGVVRFSIKPQEKGQFTSKLFAALKPGTWLNLAKPQGEFTFVNDAKRHLLCAAGSGITPMISLLHSHLESTEAQVDLIYYAKEGEHDFVSELTKLRDAHPHFRFALNTRKVHGNLDKHLSHVGLDTQVYLCGPFEFIDNAHAALDELDHPPALRKAEFFKAKPIEHTLPEAEFSIATDSHTLTVTNQTSLLEQLEDKVNVIAGCRMGVCHQCQCIKKQGVVKDIRTGALSDSGNELIQLCISAPVSDLELELN